MHANPRARETTSHVNHGRERRDRLPPLVGMQSLPALLHFCSSRWLIQEDQQSSACRWLVVVLARLAVGLLVVVAPRRFRAARQEATTEIRQASSCSEEGTLAPSLSLGLSHAHDLHPHDLA